jgi:hypothetical protein
MSGSIWVGGSGWVNKQLLPSAQPPHQPTPTDRQPTPTAAHLLHAVLEPPHHLLV